MGVGTWTLDLGRVQVGKKVCFLTGNDVMGIRMYVLCRSKHKKGTCLENCTICEAELEVWG